MPPQLEKNHVVPTAWQDEALAHDGVSREVPCSALKGETDPDSLPATPKSPPTRRGPPRGAQGVSGPSSSCVWHLRVFPDDARGSQCPFVLCLPPQGAEQGFSACALQRWSTGSRVWTPWLPQLPPDPIFPADYCTISSLPLIARLVASNYPPLILLQRLC